MFARENITYEPIDLPDRLDYSAEQSLADALGRSINGSQVDRLWRVSAYEATPKQFEEDVRHHGQHF